jgi:flagellar assembly protein FliH
VNCTSVSKERILWPEPLDFPFSNKGGVSEEREAEICRQKAQQALQEAEIARFQAEEEAKRILARAQEQKELLLQEARERSTELANEARERGYEEGYREGIEAAQREYASFLEQAREVIGQAYEERKKILREAEGMITDLAIAVAEKIMVKKWEDDPSFVLSVVREACQSIQGAKRVEIRVHPDDYPLVKREQEQLIQTGGLLSEWIVIPDRHVQAGGCVIHTEKGTVDARLETQLAELKNALRQAAGGWNDEEQAGAL